jgi:hypothetical protein
MNTDQPRAAQMLGDNYVYEQWDCPDTIQAAFRYPGFDVVYEGMMSSSIDDGGLEFRGTEATLKINRSGFGVYRESAPGDQNPVLAEKSYRDGTITHMENFFDCIPPGAKRTRRSRSSSRPRRPHRQPGLPPRRPDRMAAEELNIMRVK